MKAKYKRPKRQNLFKTILGDFQELRVHLLKGLTDGFVGNGIAVYDECVIEKRNATGRGTYNVSVTFFLNAHPDFVAKVVSALGKKFPEVCFCGDDCIRGGRFDGELAKVEYAMSLLKNHFHSTSALIDFIIDRDSEELSIPEKMAQA